MAKRSGKGHLVVGMLGAFLAATGAGFAQTMRYVWTNSPAPGGGYLTWNTAAHSIQAAINAADTNDVIIVTNGVYDTGGVSNYPTGCGLTNRVAIHKPVSVQSVNGASNTCIVGRWHVPGNPNCIVGSNAVRCVYMTNDAVLSGFTLTNGATASNSVAPAGNTECRGGGLWCESTNATIRNCVIANNTAWYYGGGAYRGTLYDCLIISNAVWTINQSRAGGGAIGSILYNCTLVGNTAGSGGAAGNTTWLYNCRLERNYASTDGGGAFMSYLYNCLVVGNTCPAGGGVFNGWNVGVQYNCIIVGNRGNYGGGVYSSDCRPAYQTVNCLIAGNYAVYNGGGVSKGNLFNCTVTGNSAASSGNTAGGGTVDTTNWNSIVYNNVMRNGDSTNDYRNYTNCVFYYSCSVPLAAGAGNIDVDPMFKNPGSGYGLNHVLGDYRLGVGSPCVNAGSNFSWQTLDPLNCGRDQDIEGGPRIYFGTVDMGAYEHLPPGTIFTIRGQ